MNKRTKASSIHTAKQVHLNKLTSELKLESELKGQFRIPILMRWISINNKVFFK